MKNMLLLLLALIVVPAWAADAAPVPSSSEAPAAVQPAPKHKAEKHKAKKHKATKTEKKAVKSSATVVCSLQQCSYGKVCSLPKCGGACNTCP